MPALLAIMRSASARPPPCAAMAARIASSGRPVIVARKAGARAAAGRMPKRCSAGTNAAPLPTLGEQVHRR